MELLICNGAPIMDSDEGQIVELALALGKKRSVLRARTGSRDGLHAKVLLKNKPVNHRRIFGFDWTENETLVPNKDYSTVELIFSLALAGNGYVRIIDILKKKGIPSPNGDKWGRGVLSHLLRQPVYAGRFAALKTSTIRASNRSGKVIKPLPESEWVFIPTVTIEKHPISWEQRSYIFHQIQKRMEFAKRHATHDYLLRGMIECDIHLTIKGKHKVYHSYPLPHSYSYFCSGEDGHRHNFISGEKFESAVKKVLTDLFESENPRFWQKLTNLEKINRPQLEADLKKQQGKLAKSLQNEAVLEARFISGQTRAEVYELLHAKFNTERRAIEEGLQDIQKQLDAAADIEAKVQSFDEIRTQFLANSENFTHSQWRALLEALDCRIRVFAPEEAPIDSHYNLYSGGFIHETESVPVSKESPTGVFLGLDIQNDIIPGDAQVPTEANLDNSATPVKPSNKTPGEIPEDAKEQIRRFILTPDFPCFESAVDKFVLETASDGSFVLDKFNAVMTLQSPVKVPQKIVDIGLLTPKDSG
jgi:hypothetical protein